ncbi:MAG: PD-(D/E)XK nuclease family protein [Gammaproteobacteria bacterium]
MIQHLQLIPYDENLLATLADHILEYYSQELPDLTGCQIIVFNTLCIPQLRKHLLTAAKAKGYQAILGPSIQSLENWLNSHSPVAESILNHAAKELVLVDAIRHSSIFRDADPWQLTDELLDLFDALTAANWSPDESLENFRAQLAQAYGITAEQPAAFNKETEIVHSLWYAWHSQLEAEQQIDAASAEITQMQCSLQALTHKQASLWFVAPVQLSQSRAYWIKQLLDKKIARVYLQANNNTVSADHTDTPVHKILQQLELSNTQRTGDISVFSAYLDTLFTADGTIKDRARIFSGKHRVDPFANRLQHFMARSPEQEAMAVELQVRRWVLEGQTSIAIITEDRRLARRIRALLERSGIDLVDTAGWALSTTSAAAVVERWLETVEQDFAQGPLLDTLKSPFLQLDDNRPEHLHTVRRLEQDIIVHENIASNLNRYRRHLSFRAARLVETGQWVDKYQQRIEQLLNQLEHAADPFSALLPDTHATTHPASHFTSALIQSLDMLGLQTSLDQDPAGSRLLQEIQQLHNTAIQNPIDMQWLEFRGWLGRTLERYTFKPTTSKTPVQLLSLAQSHLLKLSAVIIAGCTADHLPGAQSACAIFNQPVRNELGLLTSKDKQAIKRYHFRQALESADNVLLSYSESADGQENLPSPWLELMKTGHSIAYGNTFMESELNSLLQQSTAFPCKDLTPLPEPLQAPPKPTLPGTRLTDRWSASLHQTLIDCPYRFFAASGLGLQVREEIRLALAKADFGSYVHQILQTFHNDWKQAIADNREAAEQALTKISNKTFKKAIGENFSARSWLQLWKKYIPLYLDWQSKREKDWQVYATEQALKKKLSSGIEIHGRMDRIDRQGNTQAIIDYKTGRTAKLDEVLAGENVQLSTYALLADDNISEITYVKIGNDKIDDKVSLEQKDIVKLVNATENRLNTLIDQISTQTPLPAWGDDNVCQYCEFDTLCRRQSWATESETHD